MDLYNYYNDFSVCVSVEVLNKGYNNNNILVLELWNLKNQNNYKIGGGRFRRGC